MKKYVQFVTLIAAACFGADTVHAADAPRHRFSVTEFRAENMPAESVLPVRRAFVSRMGGRGSIDVKENAGACADAPCAKRVAVSDGAQRVLMGIVKKSARRIMKGAATADNKTALADSYNITVRVFDAASGRIEYTTGENAMSENELPRAAGRIADRIVARYARIPVPADPAAVPERNRAAEPPGIAANRMTVGVSGMAMRMEGSFGRFADYGFGAKADVLFGDRSHGGLRMVASLGAVGETGLVESVESSRMGFLQIGAGWEFQFTRGFGIMPYASAGYVAHMVKGTTADDPGSPPESRFYYDPTVTAGMNAGFCILRPLYWTMGISYNVFFEKDNTGRFSAVTIGLLLEL